MVKRSVYLTCTLLFFSAPFHAHAFEMDLDGSVVINWMNFRNTIESYKRKIKLRENIEQAAEAEKIGRKYFLEGRYEKAYYLGYKNAIGYIPRSEYFFIAGELKLRTTLSLHSDSPHTPPEYRACWNKYKFAVDVNRDLES